MNLDLTQWSVGLIFLFFLIGLGLLFGGGNFLVQGSSRLAQLFGIHPVVIGLTVVALGTSMPEFVVSLVAALKGKTDVALGNVVGSNVTNIGLILGLSALARPLSIHMHLLKVQVPIVIGISLLFWILCANNTILGRGEGLLLSSGFLIYLAIVIKQAPKNSKVVKQEYSKYVNKKNKVLINIFYVIVGCIGLTFGADWVVTAVSEISHRLGASELILGLTIVALGTSLPELATSVVAAIKKEGDISAGNIVGSNLFNMMAIAGPSALAHPLVVAGDLISKHLPAMFGLTLILFPLLKTGKKLGRLEGAFLVLCYIGIMSWWIVK